MRLIRDFPQPLVDLTLCCMNLVDCYNGKRRCSWRSQFEQARARHGRRATRAPSRELADRGVRTGSATAADIRGQDPQRCGSRQDRRARRARLTADARHGHQPENWLWLARASQPTRGTGTNPRTGCQARGRTAERDARASRPTRDTGTIPRTGRPRRAHCRAVPPPREYELARARTT